MRAEGEQKPSGAVERASHDDARPTESTAYTSKGINALRHFNSRAGEEKGGLEGKTPVLPSRVWYCIPPAACRLLCAAQMRVLFGVPLMDLCHKQSARLISPRVRVP